MAPDTTRYNLKSPSVKRLMREACELAEATDEYHAAPLEDNIFEWHFTIRGPPGTEFEGGLYHGRIILPTQYPMLPPNIILLTPNGRFETNKKICLSISGHHPESWQPSWSIRTALLALIAFMPTNSAGTIGSLDYTKEERQVLAKKSLVWECDACGKICDKLSTGSDSGTSHRPLTFEESSLISQISLKAEEETTAIGDGEVEKTVIEKSETVTNEGDAEDPSSATSLLPEQLLEASSLMDHSSKLFFGDKAWSAAIWAIVSVIFLLLIRRFFFME